MQRYSSCCERITIIGTIVNVEVRFDSDHTTIQIIDEEVDIQNELGKIGQETHKFECYLYTPEYDNYKYRVFFIKYDTSNYPVNIILEESVAKSIKY